MKNLIKKLSLCVTMIMAVGCSTSEKVVTAEYVCADHGVAIIHKSGIEQRTKAWRNSPETDETKIMMLRGYYDNQELFEKETNAKLAACAKLEQCMSNHPTTCENERSIVLKHGDAQNRLFNAMADMQVSK